jgi:phosphoribosylanthranilate isomerase
MRSSDVSCTRTASRRRSSSRSKAVGSWCSSGSGAGFIGSSPAARLDLAQLSGDESAHVLTELQRRAYKAIQPRTVDEAIEDVQFFAPLGPPQDYHPEILVDGYHPDLRGGTGLLADPEIAQQVRAYSPRMMLAGGLNPDNIAEKIRIIQPFAVDVASGVEAEKGIKDHDKVRAFIQNARAAAEEIEQS